MYYLVYGLLYAFSLLPFAVLHRISDFACFILYHVVGYRKEVVMKNLAQAFPEKTEAERVVIAKRFYRNFTDNFIESIKLLSCSRAFLEKHFEADFSVVHEVYATGKKAQLLVGHNFNWELALSRLPMGARYKTLIVYLKLSSGLFERLMHHMRSRTGAILLPATEMREAIAPHRNSQYMIVLGADQRPADTRNAYWVPFLNRKTAFVRGPENAARKENTPVIFSKFLRIKRGYYKMVFEMGPENPAHLPEGEMTRQYAVFLEKFIYDNPDMWLWSHRRWKEGDAKN